MGLFHSPRIVTDQLKCLVDANNPKSYSGSGSTWTDLSGNNNNITHITGVSYNASGWFQYNGAAYSSIPNGTIVGDNNFSSMSIWFRVTTAPTTENYALISDNFGPEWGLWYLTNGNATAYAYGARGTAAAVNKWHNLVVTSYTPAPNSGLTYTMQGFLNGVQISTDLSGTVGNGMDDTPLYVGADYNGNVPRNFFIGDIAQIALYQKILTPSEVKQNYNALRGRFDV